METATYDITRIPKENREKQNSATATIRISPCLSLQRVILNSQRMTPFILLVIVLTLVIILIVTNFVPFFINRKRIMKSVSVIPGPPGFPIIGNLFDFLVEPEELFLKVHQMNKEYYPFYKVVTPKFVACVIVNANDAEILMSSHKHITKSQLYNFLHPWFGTGLLTSTGKKWQGRRKILTPAFHFNVLREFTEIFEQESRRMVNYLKSANGEITIDLVAFMTKSTLNTICETAMGTSLVGEESSDDFQKTYRTAIHTLGETMLHRLLRPWIHNSFIFSLTKGGRLQKKCLQIVRGFSKKIIGERQQYHEETKGIHLEELYGDDSNIKIQFNKSSKKRLAMLDLLIAAMKKSGNIDEDGIREEVDTFMFEGHDTTAMALVFVLLLLAEHKECQDLARAEVDEVMKNCGGKIGMNELQHLPYLERCIKESLRLYPSVPFISRSITEDLQLTNYKVPAGVMCHMYIDDIHRDPNFWPNPYHFDPDRFLPENILQRHPFQYIPFSAGPRNCIGQKFAMMEMKMMTSYLLHNFYLEPVDLAADIRMLPDLVLRPKGEARIKFVPRNM